MDRPFFAFETMPSLWPGLPASKGGLPCLAVLDARAGDQDRTKVPDHRRYSRGGSFWVFHWQQEFLETEVRWECSRNVSSHVESM